MTTVSKELIDSKIKGVVFYNAGVAAAASGGAGYSKEILDSLSLVTHCMIILENNFKVEGISACVDPAVYNEDIGKQRAYEDAYNKIWQLEGYLLRQAMFEEAQTKASLADFKLDDCEGGGCKI